MKILILADIVPFPPNTGIKIRTFNIIRELSRNNDEVYLICFNHRIFLPTEREKNECRRELEKFCKEVHILEIPSEKNKFSAAWALAKNVFQRLPYRVFRYDSAEGKGLVRSIHQRVGIDVFHLDKTEFFEYSHLIPDVPAIPTNHNVESRLFQRRAKREVSFPRQVFSWLQYKKTEAYEKHALNRVPAYIVCTDIDGKYFENELGVTSRPVVVPNGVDIDYYRPSAETEPYFLIIGAQSREATANFDATIHFRDDIWPRLRELGMPVKIVGRNPDAELIAWADSDPLVEVVGFVDDERKYLGAAMALLVPLRIGGGSRLKILTAMSMGVPVVSTPVGAEGIECTNGVDILLAESVADYCSEVERLVKSTELQSIIRKNSRQQIESLYDWKIIGNSIRKLYLELTLRP